MKTVHNIKIIANSKTQEELTMLELALKEFIEKPIKKYIELETLEHPDFDTIYQLKLWLDKQPYIRAFIEKLKQELSENVLDEIVNNPELYLDHHDIFNIKLEKKSFINGTLAQGTKDVILIRMNIAAYPKNEENILKAIKELFS